MSIEYQKGTSTLHGLDARTKLLLFAGLTIVAIVVADPVIIAILFAILYMFGAAAVSRKLLNRNLRVLVVIFLTFSLFQILFFTPKDAFFLFYLIPWKGWVPVTVQGIIRGLAVFFRFFIVVLSVHLMLYTTPPVDLVLAVTRREQKQPIYQKAGVILILGIILLGMVLLTAPDALQRLPSNLGIRAGLLTLAALVVSFLVYQLMNHGLPPEMGVALSLGFATVGILSQQTQKITDAQKARGYDVQPKNLLRRVQVLTALLMPIFLATMERSQDIAVAILARGFDYNIAARTYRRHLAFRRDDFLALGIIVVLILGVMVLNRVGLGNPTEQVILGLIEF